MMRLKNKILWCGLLLFLVSSCIKDTCNGELGNTFNTIEKETLELDPSGDLIADFSTVTLEDLPSDYFEYIIFSDSITEIQTTSIKATKTSITLTLSAAALPISGETQTYKLNYVLDDRRNHIDCQHPGSTDQYYLEMSFKLIHLSEENFTLSDFMWNEIFAAGHL